MDLKDYLAGYNKEYWWFVGKRELITHLLKTFTPSSHPHILDAGCGMGEDLEAMSQFGTVTVLDQDPEALAYVPAKYPKILVNVEEWRGPRDSFDMALLFDVLEHTDQPKRVLENIRRILRPGGICCIIVPAYMMLWSPHDVYLGHRKRYTISELRKELGDFQMIFSTYWNSMLFPFILPWRLLRRMLIRRPASDVRPLPKPVNKMLLGIIRFENMFIQKGLRFPFGTSIVGVVRKPPR